MTLLKLHDVSVHFPIRKGIFKKQVGVFKAISNASLEVEKGQVFAFVGASGSGKTTLARACAGLNQITQGRVEFAGNSEKEIAMVFQNPLSSLNPRKMILTQLIEPQLVQKQVTNKQEAELIAIAMLEEVGLEKTALLKYPHEFSGGQLQRICLARALVLKPSLLILDEALSQLDISIQAQVLNLLVKLKEKFGFATLFISHDLDSVQYLADRIAVFCQGEIVEIQNTEDLFKSPSHPYTKELLASMGYSQ